MQTCVLRTVSRHLLAGAATLALVGAAQAGAIITFGQTSMGVNDTGELNFAVGGAEAVGLARAGVGDAISPGCWCESWGVALSNATGSFSTFAGQSAGFGGFSTVEGANTFGATASTATSLVTMAGLPVTIRHAFGPSLVEDVFQVQVTITNQGSSTLDNLVYRRAMDWDVPPTPFSEYVTHVGVANNLVANNGNVLYAGNNGFATGNPLVSAEWDSSVQNTWAGGSVNTTNTDFNKAGSADHGSVFDFAFGALAAGQSRVFNIYYGSAANEAQALSKVGALGANLYSLGQSSDPGLIGEEGPGEISVASDAVEGSPEGPVVVAPAAATPGFDPAQQATFLFAFGGVGGTELGSTQGAPLLPFVEAPGQYSFTAPVSGRWYDPPFATGFTISVDGADVTVIEAPTGFDNMVITVDGAVVDSDFDGGETFAFADGVRSFTITFAPGTTVDVAAAAPFPLYMEFDGSASRMTWTAALAPVPEAGTLGMMLAGMAAMVGVTTRRRRHQAA
jgi:hypothetical protein